MEPRGSSGKLGRDVLDRDDDKKWVFDSSIDHKGNIPLRASTGGWKASLFIIAIEFGERLSYFGLSTNLIIYLTKVLHKEVKTAAKCVNYWIGVTTMLPLLGGFIADGYLGRFATVLVSSIIYLIGLILLTLTQVIPSLKPCSSCNPSSLKLHEIIFFIAMYLISAGTSGHKPSLESFGADQFDDDHPTERKNKMSFFNWWSFGLCCGLLLGVTVIVYVQDNVSWGLADFVLTVVMGLCIVVFVVGRPFYRFRVAEGSPLTPMIQVLVAAAKKRSLDYPDDDSKLYEVKNISSQKKKNDHKRLLKHSNKFRCLDKAAIIEDNTNDPEAQEKLNPWRLTTVTQVEEVKLILSMLPIWLVSIPFGICVAQTSTFFIKQASTMDRHIAGNLEIPPATIYSLGAVGMIISVIIFDKLLVPVLRKSTGSERGISILKRMGIGMVFSVAAMITAALIEKKRLNIAHKEGNPIMVSMSVFWLVPQFIILGFGDGFALVGLQEYFYDQVPDNMRSLGIALYLSVLGAGNFLSSLLITVVDHITTMGGKTSWFAKSLNNSRLDYFYWLLAVINGVNMCVYVYLAKNYSYKTVQRRVASALSSEGDEDDVFKSTKS